MDYLASTDSHPTARQVFAEIKTNFPQLSLATVYNTLGTLVRMGLIRVLEFETMDNRHETNLAPHINLICTGCGRIQDLAAGLPICPDEVREKLGFEVRDHRLEYYGLCAECRERGDTQE